MTGHQDPDECPGCGRWISDLDPEGCEATWGQRYCLRHLPDRAPGDDPEDAAWLRMVRSEGR